MPALPPSPTRSLRVPVLGPLPQEEFRVADPTDSRWTHAQYQGLEFARAQLTFVDGDLEATYPVTESVPHVRCQQELRLLLAQGRARGDGAVADAVEHGAPGWDAIWHFMVTDHVVGHRRVRAPARLWRLLARPPGWTPPPSPLPSDDPVSLS